MSVGDPERCAFGVWDVAALLCYDVGRHGWETPARFIESKVEGHLQRRQTYTVNDVSCLFPRRFTPTIRDYTSHKVKISFEIEAHRAHGYLHLVLAKIKDLLKADGIQFDYRIIPSTYDKRLLGPSHRQVLVNQISRRINGAPCVNIWTPCHAAELNGEVQGRVQMRCPAHGMSMMKQSPYQVPPYTQGISYTICFTPQRFLFPINDCTMVAADISDVHHFFLDKYKQRAEENMQLVNEACKRLYKVPNESNITKAYVLDWWLCFEFTTIHAAWEFCRYPLSDDFHEYACPAFLINNDRERFRPKNRRQDSADRHAAYLARQKSSETCTRPLPTSSDAAPSSKRRRLEVTSREGVDSEKGA